MEFNASETVLTAEQKRAEAERFTAWAWEYLRYVEMRNRHLRIICGYDTDDDYEMRFNPNHDDKGRFTFGHGGGGNISANGLTSGGNGGIMKIATTKLSPDGKVIDPMDSTRYRKIKANLEKRGCSVVATASGSDEERFLKLFGAEAISDKFGIMHLGETPSASAFFEEIIHYTQIQKYGDVEQNDFVERAAREVAANRKLLKHSKAYGFTETDYLDIQRNLSTWEKDFKKRVGVTYDQSNYRRDV